MKYRKDIDGLRAVAILPVVFYHADATGFRGGFVGVDVFFVISGYLITGLLLDEIRKTGSIDLANFYARRARRLLPALLLVILVTLALGAVILTPVGNEQVALARSAIAALLFYSNFYFASSTGGYFDPATESLPLLHTWSLGVEEQFYFVWPVLLLACVWAARSRKFSKYLIPSLGIVFAFSLFYSYWAALGNSQTAHFSFFMLITRAWELGIGALLAYALPQASKPMPKLGAAISVLGLAAVLFATAHFQTGMPYPGIAALVPTLGAAAIIAGGALAPNGKVRQLLSSRLFVGVGLISYSWYLWHWPILVYGRMMITTDNIFPFSLILIALSFGLAVLTFLYIEQPLRKNKYSNNRAEVQTLSTAAVAILATICISQGLAEYSKYLKRHDPEYSYLVRAEKDVGWSRQRCLHRGDDRFSALKPLNSCIERPEGARQHIVLWGDSHADHYAGMIEKAAKLHNIGVLPRTMTGCPPIFDVHIRSKGKDRNSCDQFNQKVISEIEMGVASSEVIAVVVSARWTQYTGTPTIGGRLLSHQLVNEHTRTDDQPALLELGLRSALKALSNLGVKILLIKPIPEQPHKVPSCLAWKTAEQCSVKLQRAETHRSTANMVIDRAVSNISGIQLWDPFGAMCDEEVCLVKRDDIIMYRDDDHLSYSGAVWLSHKFTSTLVDWLFVSHTLHEDRR